MELVQFQSGASGAETFDGLVTSGQMVFGGSGLERSGGSWRLSGLSVGVCAGVVICWLVLRWVPRFVGARSGWLRASSSVRGVGVGLGAGRILGLAASAHKQHLVLFHWQHYHTVFHDLWTELQAEQCAPLVDETDKEVRRWRVGVRSSVHGTCTSCGRGKRADFQGLFGRPTIIDRHGFGNPLPFSLFKKKRKEKKTTKENKRIEVLNK